MESTSLTTLAGDRLTAARRAHSGTAAQTIHGGRNHAMRQMILALADGRGLAEHENPGEATLYVLQGSVRLATATQTWTGSSGEHVTIPSERHSLTAITDAVVLLTILTRPPR